MVEMISNPTFNKNNINGWETRLIFSQNYPQEMDLTGDDYFHAVTPNIIRGTPGVFPREYWTQGKILRLKANMFYSGGGAKFNISTRFNDGSSSLACRSDNGNDHYFAEGNTVYNVPVDLEITYVRSGSDNGFNISGFYQYEWGSYDTGGNNNRVVRVPLNYVQTSSLFDFTNPTRIVINVENQAVQFNWMTIEELG